MGLRALFPNLFRFYLQYLLLSNLAAQLTNQHEFYSSGMSANIYIFIIQCTILFGIFHQPIKIAQWYTREN